MLWATVWATITGGVGIESSDDNGSAGIDHLRIEQLVSPDGVPLEGGLDYWVSWVNPFDTNGSDG